MTWFDWLTHRTAPPEPAPGLRVVRRGLPGDPYATHCYINPVAEHQYYVVRDGRWVPIKVLSC